MRADYPALWFRMYAEFATDPKVQMLSEIDQRRFLMILCLRCGNGSVTLHDTQVAFQLRVTDDEWAKTKRVLVGNGLISDDNKPCKWEKRQFVSDTSNQRVRRFREKMKRDSVTCNVTVTAPETETETETESKSKSSVTPKRDRQTGTRLPEEFIPKRNHYQLAKELGINCDMEFQKFRDYFLGVSGTRAVKRDWDATLRNWLRNSLNFGGRNGGTELNKAQKRALNNQAAIIAGLGLGGDVDDLFPAPGPGFTSGGNQNLGQDVFAIQPEGSEMGIRGTSQNVKLLPKTC